ncbi:MAG: hypothetical protein RBS96_02645 [Dehalococcoidales bacterium]|jgi:hypothetical protein|nr:hypothetical protein [Syntrophales bacterium]MDX9802914.1 hypothetical protein [Dehalococcoidales bacterium]
MGHKVDYCERHSFHYNSSHLKDCPICVGQRMHLHFSEILDPFSREMDDLFVKGNDVELKITVNGKTKTFHVTYKNGVFQKGEKP